MGKGTMYDSSKKVQIREISIGGNKGYDLLVCEDDATVADYLESLNEFIEKGAIDRQRHDGGREYPTCKACHNCCRERIPITSVDLWRLSEEKPINEIFAKYLRVSVQGRVVDITLKLGPEGVCRLNNSDSQLCSIYRNRPFVCQTYICCSLSRRALKLRETVLNTGEDQLVRDWIRMVDEGTVEPRIDEAEDWDLREEDWEPTPFEGKTSYAEILLKDLCSSQLWEKIRGIR